MTFISSIPFVRKGRPGPGRVALLCSLAVAWGCSAPAPQQPGDASPSSGGTSSGNVATGGNVTTGGNAETGGTGTGGNAETGGAPGAPAVNPLGRARCRAPEGVSPSPRNTEEAVQLLNALPKPTSVACFVESLARPLTLYATSSQFSAQPALSTQSPRLFIKLGELWISVVIDGDSSYLIEFGTIVADDPLRSIKGELRLPIDAPVPASAPYDRVRRDAGTVCGLCHYAEEPAPGITFANAFSSIAFRPRPDTRVDVEQLRGQAEHCDWQVEPQRCEMLSAVFDGGTVSEAPFPDDMKTFF